MMIPRIIHQIYHPFPPRTGDEVPHEIFHADWVESIKHNHPGWAYVLWTKDASRDLVANYYPDFLPAYDAYDVPIKKVDAIKYFALHRFGGAYFDLDFASLKSVEPLLKGQALVFANQLDRGDDHFETSAVNNAFMASSPKHSFWEEVFRRLKENPEGSVFEATGPVMLTAAVREYAKHHSDIAILERKYIYPYRYNETAKASYYGSRSLAESRRDFPEAYAVTFWTQSFTPHDVPAD